MTIARPDGAGQNRVGSLEPLFSPDRIAVVGASDDVRKPGGNVMRALTRGGYGGEIYPINPTKDSIFGLPAHSSLSDVEQPIDLVIAAVRADDVGPVLLEADRLAVPAAIVFASGFGEAGVEGEARQRALDEALARAGAKIRILGPNSLGMTNLNRRVTACFGGAFQDELPPGGSVAIMTQSGALGDFIASASKPYGLRFSYIVHPGNAMDVTGVELLNDLVDTPETDVLMAYLEGMTEGRGLVAVARRARQLGKPLIVLKAGRSPSAAAAALSHTASLAGDDRVFQAIARDEGIVRTTSITELWDAALLFSTGRRARGRRVTIVGPSGGECVVAADEVHAAGLTVHRWDGEWYDRMAAVLPPFAGPGNPMDLTAMITQDHSILPDALAVAAQSPLTDMLLITLGLLGREEEPIVKALLDLNDTTELPVAVVWIAPPPTAIATLAERGIPCYDDSSRAAAALAHLADYTLASPSHSTNSTFPTAPSVTERARALLDEVRRSGRTQLNEAEGLTLLELYGIAVPRARVVHDVDDAVIAAAECGYPVVVKIHADGVAHKSDVDGVRLGLLNAEQVRSACAEISNAATRRGVPEHGYLVEPMIDGGAEMMIGATVDPNFGPMVTLGAGGILCELFDDVVTTAAPVAEDRTLAVLEQVRIDKVLRGFRSDPGYDRAAFVRTVVRLSLLVDDLQADIAEIDVNPVMVGRDGHGATALDVLVALRPLTSADSGPATPTATA